MKYLLKNGRIYDGTGGDAFQGDILICGDRIEAVGEGLACQDAQEIDLRGLSVSSGFFDAHSHNDWFAIKKEPLPYFAPFIRQGITSFITGNCGLSAVGFEKNTKHLDKIGGGLFGYQADTTGVFWRAIAPPGREYPAMKAAPLRRMRKRACSAAWSKACGRARAAFRWG